VELINLFFVGHLDDSAILAGIGLGNMSLSIFGFCVICGFNSALETLVSQAYGMGSMYLCGVYLNKGRIIITIIFVPIVLILLLSDRILISLGQDQMSAYYALKYIQIILPGLFFQAHFDCIYSFLNCMNRSYIPMIVQLITMFFHGLWCYLFVHVGGLGFKGTSLATCVTYCLNLVIISIYVSCSKDLKEAWFLPNKDCFRDFKRYFKIAIPGTFMLCLEWWTFEILTLFSGLISVDVNAAEVILINLFVIFYTIPYGIQSSAIVVVGNSIGENNVIQAKNYAKIIMMIGISFNFLICLSLFIFKNSIASLFTNDEVVVKLTSKALIFASFSFFFDSC